MPQPSQSKVKPQLAIMAGGGHLPASLAVAAAEKGWPVHLITFASQPQPEPFSQPPASQTSFGLGAIGKILAHLKKHGVTHVTLAGHLNKPSLFNLKLDARGLTLLIKLLRENSFHDDALLRTVTTVLQEEGFTVLGVADLAPGLLAPTGNLSRAQPGKEDMHDIQLALAALHKLGELDIGQAAVVHHATILGVEAVEGTDALLDRCAHLRGPVKPTAHAGFLVKIAKPGQTDLADLPTIGPATLQKLIQHRYRGVVVQAGHTLLIDQPKLIQLADTHGLVILAVE